MRVQIRLPLFIALALIFNTSIANELSDRKVYRLALVIGNSQYSLPANPWTRLNSPAKDAKDVGQLLVESGFSVQVLSDKQYAVLYPAVLKFLNRIDELRADIIERKAESRESIAAIFYYSGHGYSQEGQLYLTATDTSGKYVDDLVPVSLRLSAITDRLFAETGQVELLSFLFLDACRTSTGLPSRSYGRGKGAAPFKGRLLESSSGNGGVILFASSDGKPSIDGRSTQENSVFTQAFIKVAKTADSSIGIFDFMNTVGVETRRISFEQGFRPAQTTEVRGAPLTGIRFKGAVGGISANFAQGVPVATVTEPVGTLVSMNPPVGSTNQQSTRSKTGGWIWLGDFVGPSKTQGQWLVEKSKLSTGGALMPPGSIAPASKLLATTGLYVREQFPELSRCKGLIPKSGNYAECVTLVGFVPRGSVYETIGTPKLVRTPSGRSQYWVEVKSQKQV